MASSLARLVSSGFLSRSLLYTVRPVVASVSRSFCSSGMPQYRDGSHEGDRRSERATRPSDNFSSDDFDPFSPTRSLSRVLNQMGQFMDMPFLSASRWVGAGFRSGWDAQESEDALHLQLDMPGLDKENVKISVEHNILTIKGEGGDDEENVQRHSSRIHLPIKFFKTDKIKAEMKNGVLKVVVPKVKEKGRIDGVFQVKVE